MTPENRKRFVTDAVSQMKFVKDAKSRANDAFMQLLDKLAHILTDVKAHITPILKAGGGFDEPALKQMVFTFLQEEIHKKLNKDEREVLLVILLSDSTMDDIRTNPGGSDKGPDLLSGV